MADYQNFYAGADYGLDPNYGLEGSDGYGNFTGYTGHRLSAGDIGFAADATTANQLDVLSKKISTGTKVVEVQGLGIMGGGGAMSHMDKIPKQQWKEMERLKKLTGVNLTFHGPLVEPTGVSRQGWDDTQRQQAEREMTEAISRGHALDPNGNLVVTFHSSNGLPEPETTVINEKTGKPETTSMFFVNERDGQFVPINTPKKDYFEKDPKGSIMREVKHQNEEAWARELQHANFNAHNGLADIQRALSDTGVGKKEAILDFYKDYVKNPEKAEGDLNKLEPQEAAVLKNMAQHITHGDIYLREAYVNLRGLFNQAYESAERNSSKKDLKILNEFREDIAPMVKRLEEDPSKVLEFGTKINDGINKLRKIAPPERLTPLKEFALDKASETFSNVALNSYKKFKDTAPIISIENPPMGSGLSTGEDLKELVKRSREKFADEAQEKLGMSKSAAKKQAEKLIGVTWDVGHINMIRKYGYDESEVISQTKAVAPYVKHVHLSDNFGMEHTELPMGMGNVPTKAMLEAIEKYNKQAKKIVETGDWFSRQGGLSQTQTPAGHTFSAFGSPIYGMTMAPYWNQTFAASGGYSAGFGVTNPAIHHSIYGAGYSNLPVELGGQMAGQSRMGGAPIE